MKYKEEPNNLMMDAILLKEYGGPDQLYLGQCQRPIIASDEILVEVKASALNRADTLQRRGLYPPPPGASEVLGLEMAGVVRQVGDAVMRWQEGDRVFGLLAGGGYARYVAIHQDIAMPIPDRFSFEEAAAMPEVFLTAYQALRYLADIQKGERILIHAGASGVGTAAIQLAKSMGASQIICTASKSKHELCYALGATQVVDYKSEDFEPAVMRDTADKGVNVIIDFLAAPYFQRNINSLDFNGRMIMLALMGGVKADQINLANILRKRLHIMGSTLRARSSDYKIQLTKDFLNYAMSKLSTGEIIPVIDSTYSWTDVADAHRYMEANKNKGKIVLKMDE